VACSSLWLIPSLLAATCALKPGARGETYDRVIRTDRPSPRPNWSSSSSPLLAASPGSSPWRRAPSPS